MLLYNNTTLWQYHLLTRFSLKNVYASGCIICDTTCRTWHYLHHNCNAHAKI